MYLVFVLQSFSSDVYFNRCAELYDSRAIIKVITMIPKVYS